MSKDCKQHVTKDKQETDSRPKGLKNDTYARPTNLTLASSDLDLWPTDPQSWPFHARAPWTICATWDQNQSIRVQNIAFTSFTTDEETDEQMDRMRTRLRLTVGRRRIYLTICICRDQPNSREKNARFHGRVFKMCQIARKIHRRSLRNSRKIHGPPQPLFRGAMLMQTKKSVE